MDGWMDDLLKSSLLHTCLESCVVLSCLHEDTPNIISKWQKAVCYSYWKWKCAYTQSYYT